MTKLHVREDSSVWRGDLRCPPQPSYSLAASNQEKPEYIGIHMVWSREGAARSTRLPTATSKDCNCFLMNS